MGRVYAGWGLSQAFYREEIWCKIGFSSLEDFLIGSWEANSAAATLTTCWR
jgi:homoserine O-acetyltransferase